MTKPPLILGVDFETSSACDLKRAGAWAYSCHRSTVVLCAVFCFSTGKDDPHEYIRWQPSDGAIPQRVSYAMVYDRVPLLAHNRGFEIAIVENVLGWDIPPERWLDTMPMGAAINLPRSLDGLAFALGCPVQKDAEGKKLMLKMCKASTTNEMTVFSYPMSDDPVARKRLLDYCELDVGAMLDCYWRLPELSDVQERVLAADHAINNRGIYIDREFAANCAYLARSRKVELDREVFSLTVAELADSRSPIALKEWLRGNDVDIPTVMKRKQVKAPPETHVEFSKRLKAIGEGTWRPPKPVYAMVPTETCDKAAVAKMLQDPDIKDEVRQVLLNRVESNKVGSLGKLDRVPEMVAGDGRLYGALAYGAAHTLRWSSYGMQIHNLAKNKMEPVEADMVLLAIKERSPWALSVATDAPLAAISQSIRSMITAPPGRELIAADWSAIQARILPWLAHHDTLVEQFRNDEPVYVLTAAGFGLKGCGKGVAMMESGDHRAVCALCSKHRDVGKVAVLSLGFMMGPVKFADRGEAAGIELSLKEWKHFHVAWRGDNIPIVDFASDLEDAAVNAIENPGQAFHAGRIKAIASKLCLALVLPSGRQMRYWHPKMVFRTKKYTTLDDGGNLVEGEMEGMEIEFSKPSGTGMVRESTYSGKLSENVTQAVEADLMGLALAELEETSNGLDVVAHVHDSICCEALAGAGSVDELCAIMERAYPWAVGLPLKAEGYRSHRFKG